MLVETLEKAWVPPSLSILHGSFARRYDKGHGGTKMAGMSSGTRIGGIKGLGEIQ